MNRAFLEELGLVVREAGGVIEADLELTSGQAVNPITRQFITRAQFTVVGDRLIPIGPAELVGVPPINLAHISRAAALEDILIKSLNEAILHLQRRSEQLAALGLSPRVDSASLQLTAELEFERWRFTIGTDRLGNFRVARAAHDGDELTTSSSHGFELGEFRERGALEAYLGAMFGEGAGRAATPAKPPQRDADVDTDPQSPAAPLPEAPVYFSELVGAFGARAAVPGRSAVEVLIELRVGEERYRFAAARVAGRTFRGLLAGSQGKLWADRFDLGEFPGIEKLLAKVLGVAETTVEVLG